MENLPVCVTLCTEAEAVELLCHDVPRRRPNWLYCCQDGIYVLTAGGGWLNRAGCPSKGNPGTASQAENRSDTFSSCPLQGEEMQRVRNLGSGGQEVS